MSINIEIELREEYATPYDKRTRLYKKFRERAKECTDIRTSEYGTWANLAVKHIKLFTSFSLN